MRPAFFSALALSVCFLAASVLGQTKAEAISFAQAKSVGVSLPACVYCPAPEYTKQARKAKLHGTVVVQVEVTIDGRPDRISVTKGLGSGLDEKAIEAVKKWRFTPAHDSEGHAVVTQGPVDVTFSLY